MTLPPTGPVMRAACPAARMSPVTAPAMVTLFPAMFEAVARQGVTDVVVNGPEDVFMDRGEGLERSDITFRNDGEVRQLASRLAAASGASSASRATSSS